MVEWRPPPPEPHPLKDALLEAASRPGEWAMIRSYYNSESARSIARMINRRMYPYLPEGRWEAKSRRSGERVEVFARYTQ